MPEFNLQGGAHTGIERKSTEAPEIGGGGVGVWRGCRITHGSCVAKGSLGRNIFFPPLPFLQGGKRGRRGGGEKKFIRLALQF